MDAQVLNYIIAQKDDNKLRGNNYLLCIIILKVHLIYYYYLFIFDCLIHI